MKLWLRYSAEYGLILQGQTGIGKTRLARSIAFALSQYYITEDGKNMEPSIRSCSCLDMLRTEPGVRHKPVIYDDDPLDSNRPADVKALMDIQEDEVILWARWGGIKLVKLGPQSILVLDARCDHIGCRFLGPRPKCL